MKVVSPVRQKADAERQAWLLYLHAPLLPQIARNNGHPRYRSPFEVHFRHTLAGLAMLDGQRCLTLLTELELQHQCELCK